MDIDPTPNRRTREPSPDSRRTRRRVRYMEKRTPILPLGVNQKARQRAVGKSTFLADVTDNTPYSEGGSGAQSSSQLSTNLNRMMNPSMRNQISAKAAEKEYERKRQNVPHIPYDETLNEEDLLFEPTNFQDFIQPQYFQSVTHWEDQYETAAHIARRYQELDNRYLKTIENLFRLRKK